MAESDPAALAASTAQGWAHALNTVARPHPEHLAAAQEALNTLEAAERHAPVDHLNRWLGVRKALQEALENARLRVDGNGPREPGSITIAELAGALKELESVGLVTDPVKVLDAPLAQAVHDDGMADRIAELEEQLEETQEALAEAQEALRRQTALRDRFERERDAERRARVSAEAMTSGRASSIRDEAVRGWHLRTLAQLGNNSPGYQEMTTEELREIAEKRLAEVTREAGQLHQVARKLAGVGRRLASQLDQPSVIPPEADSRLADAVSLIVNRHADAYRAVRERVTELEEAGSSEGQLEELTVVRAERDMLTKARDAQAAELRALRARETDLAGKVNAFSQQNVALARQVAELEERLERQAGTIDRLQRELRP